MKPTLFVLAAGMGSRYGGLKQLDGVGPNGETIMDYSIFDAIRGGFGKIVFVIRKDFEQDFREKIISKYGNHIPVELVFQAIDDLPAGFTCPAERVKPWGTNHAVLMGKNVINEPFAVINADDFYSRDAFAVLGQWLNNLPEGQENKYCMVGFRVGNTLSENGHVARGVCETSADGYLTHIVERTKIEKRDGGICYLDDDGATWVKVDPMTPVSMNMWGYTHSFIDEVAERFPEFLNNVVPANPAKAEFFLPSTVGALLSESKATVQVLRSADRWFGVTYAADKPQVVASLKEMHNKGLYPDGLWK